MSYIIDLETKKFIAEIDENRCGGEWVIYAYKATSTLKPALINERIGKITNSNRIKITAKRKTWISSKLFSKNKYLIDDDRDSKMKMRDIEFLGNCKTFNE